jgi:hypothetical protein
LQAQGTGEVRGYVRGQRGEALPSATVKLQDAAKHWERQAVSDAAGRYAFAGLEAGSYEVEASASGFQTAKITALEVTTAAAITLDFDLSASTDTVFKAESSAAPPLLEASKTSTGTLIRRGFVENLPLNGRSFQSLLEMTPGITLTKASTTTGGQFSANGMRSNANNFVIDGVSGNVGASTVATFSQQAAGTLPALTVLGGTNSLATLDSLEEFRVETSSFAPEYGRSPGAQVILTTRSGSNQFRGALWHEFRNDKLDANDWFVNAAGRGRSPFRLNQFGGNLGGPVWKDRSFFFASYEGLRLRIPQFQRSMVPSESARQRAQGTIRNLLNAFPRANVPSPFANPDEGAFESAYSDPAESNIVNLRGDHRFSTKASVFVRYQRSPTDRLSRAFANQVTTTFLNTSTWTAGSTVAFSPRVVLESRFNYSDSRAGFEWDAGAINGAVKPDDALLFPANAPRERASAGMILGVQSGVYSSPNLTQGKSIGNGQRQWNLVESLVWNRGGHQWKVGADLRWLRPQADFREFGISYNFGSITNTIDLQRATVTVQALAPRSRMSFPSYGFFAQDNWRVSGKITINYGFRWEWVPSPSGDERPIYGADQVENPLTMQVVRASDGLWRTRKNNIAPRFGVAWKIRPDLVLRAGGGLFHDIGTGQAVRGFNGWPYNSVRTSTNAPFPPPVEALSPLPFNTSAPYSAEFFLMDPELRQPFAGHWNFGVEKEFRGWGALDLRYVGTSGRRLLYMELLRNRPAATVGGVALAATTVVNPTLFGTGSNVNVVRNRASSDYNALQAQYRRNAGRARMQVSYTYGKALDNFSDETTVGAAVSRIDRELDRGAADFDVRHNFVAAVSWNAPAPFAPKLFGGWGFDLFQRMRTATPVNLVSGTDPLNLGITSIVRPDLVAGQPLYLDDARAPGGRRFNAAAFVTPPAGRQGSLGRNVMRSFGMVQTDLGVRRDFRIRERWRLEWRGDFFNLFNRPNFGDPSGTLVGGTTVNPLFGLSSNMLGRSLAMGAGGLSPLFQVGGPRSIQFSLKVAF